jgi:hypothetical protein
VNAVVILIVAGVSLLIIGMGVFGLASPAGLVTFIPPWQSQTGLWAASLVRLVFGVALWLVAPSSRTPVVLQVLAVVSGGSALVLPFMGVVRFTALLSWWSRQSPAFVRAWSAVAVLMGGFILWAVVA